MDENKELWKISGLTRQGDAGGWRTQLVKLKYLRGLNPVGLDEDIQHSQADKSIRQFSVKLCSDEKALEIWIEVKE
jgi:hypothetical protein